MVVFTCDCCNEALKKKQVIKHRRCRNATFTCIDCNVTFTSSTYEEHNKCVTESERYGGVNYVAKEFKGETKQQSWVEQVRSVAQKLPKGSEKQLLTKALQQDNVPRKRKPFINWMKSACKVYDVERAERAWEVLQKGLVALKSESAPAADEKSPRAAAVNGLN